MAPMNETPAPPPDDDKPNSPDSNNLKFGTDDKTLSEQLRKYRAALEQEFELNNKGTGTGTLDPSENVERYTRDFFRKNLAQAAAQVVWLSSNASSDSVRLNACKIIIKEALEDARSEGDPIKELLSSLTG